MKFTDKIVLVTGGSRGIGRAVCIHFAKRGAKVAVHYGSNEEAANETLNMLEGDGHMVIKANMAHQDEVEAMVESVIENMGGLNILVNNAGIFEEHKIVETDYERWQHAWQHTIAVNLFGPANAIWCAAQHMIDHGGGRIVNVSSRGAFRGEPDAPAYGASKAGMNSMTGSLAKALAPYGIYVSTVAPGWVDTDMAADHLDDSIKAQSPLNRVATPDEIAHAVVYMASEGAEFTIGAILDVNGASYLRN